MQSELLSKQFRRDLGHKVSSSFGTAPDVWNWMFAACAKAIPPSVLATLGKKTPLVEKNVRLFPVLSLFVGDKELTLPTAKLETFGELLFLMVGGVTEYL